MEGAEHGVILLTMGMTYFPSDIPPHLEAELLEAFSKVKQRVLIKLHTYGIVIYQILTGYKISNKLSFSLYPSLSFFNHPLL